MSPKELYSVRFILISNKYISNIIYIIFQILYFHFTSLLWYNFFVFSLCFWTSFLYIVEKYCILILRLFCDVIYYYYFHYYYYFVILLLYFITIFYYYIFYYYIFIIFIILIIIIIFIIIFIIIYKIFLYRSIPKYTWCLFFTFLISFPVDFMNFF